jgi:hypothetical protein
MIRAQTELSRALVYVTSMTCGVLAAMATEILLRRTGVEIADTWHSIASGQSLQMRAVSIFWLASAGLVFALAEVGHIAAITAGLSGGAHTAMSMLALVAAALVAMFGAYFATRG